jgi:hypothetical protein
MTPSGESMILADRGRAEGALAALKDAQQAAARASSLLSAHGGRATEKQWWYDANKVFHGAYNLANELERALAP